MTASRTLPTPARRSLQTRGPTARDQYGHPSFLRRPTRAFLLFFLVGLGVPVASSATAQPLIITTLAGSPGSSGVTDGIGSGARFYGPQSVAADTAGNVFVADSGNCTIRRITSSGVVSTLAGEAGVPGSEDGTGSDARFTLPLGIAIDLAGNAYVADTFNQTIRKIAVATGEVTTLAGLAGLQNMGSADGAGSAARFYFPTSLAADGSGHVYVADTYNHTIRKIDLGKGVVSTIAGLAQQPGSVDGVGTAARFNNPQGVAVDLLGNVFVADTWNHTIRKVVAATGEVTTLAGATGSKGSTDGPGSTARFCFPMAIAASGSESLYVADTKNNSIRKIALATGTVTTVAGLVLQRGSADGIGSAARFDTPYGIAADGTGFVYVADTGNHIIRKGSLAPSLPDAAIIDKEIGPVGESRQLDTMPHTATNWLWAEIQHPLGSNASLSSTTIRNPTFTPDLPGQFVFQLTASDDSGSQSSTTVSLTATSLTGGSSMARLLPVVLDVSSASFHYTTEMALTNNTSNRLDVSMHYTASLGSRQGSGTVTDSLAPGQQRKIDDVLLYLREKGLAIPPSSEQPRQGGTLLVTFQGSAPIDPRLVSVTARTAALTAAPHPAGRAGLSYSGLLTSETSTSLLTLYGLRSSPTDRTNVAVFNASSDAVTLKVTVYSGTGDGRSVVFKEAETLPPYGWLQYGSAQILDGTGISKGWVTVERTSPTGFFSAYAVINDSKTNDGSFVPPVGGDFSGSMLTVPVLSETPQFRSELTLVNKSSSLVTLTLNYLESLSPDAGQGGVMIVRLGPQEEWIIPEAIDFLRMRGVYMNIGEKGAASYVGALQILVSGTEAANVFAGARTASQSPAPDGGLFGLFTPCVYSGQEASGEAYLYGLRSDPENRTNVAIVNAGGYSADPILLQLQAYDGDAGGVPKGEPLSLSLFPGEWAQPGNFFRNSGVANGWVRVTRMSGTAPWIAYGVVNDGGNAGERTGDGAYVPMTK